MGIKLLRPTSVEKMGKVSGENLHVDNRAEMVQPDLIVDLNYSNTVIRHKVYMK